MSPTHPLSLSVIPLQHFTPRYLSSGLALEAPYNFCHFASSILDPSGCLFSSVHSCQVLNRQTVSGLRLDVRFDMSYQDERESHVIPPARHRRACASHSMRRLTCDQRQRNPRSRKTGIVIYNRRKRDMLREARGSVEDEAPDLDRLALGCPLRRLLVLERRVRDDDVLILRVPALQKAPRVQPCLDDPAEGRWKGGRTLSKRASSLVMALT